MCNMVDLFFLLKKENKDKLQSLITRRAISSGMDSIHTFSSLPNLKFLARKWATELPTCLHGRNNKMETH